MGTTHQATFTPEQLAAVTGGEGFAEIMDPETNRVFVVIEKPTPPTIGDEYVRAKLDEAIAASERGETADWDAETAKSELHQRIAAKKRRQ